MPRLNVLCPDLQVSFFYKLKTIKELYLDGALKATLLKANLKVVNKELDDYVSEEALKKLASFGIRGETSFPVPHLLTLNPYLLGYYRLLLGFSQKDFYQPKNFSRYKCLEEKGTLGKNITPKDIEELCRSLVKSVEILVNEIDELSLTVLNELQLLTIGPQLRGSQNNTLGQVATEKVFQLIKELLGKYIKKSTLNSFAIKNDSGREVLIEFASDPDIAIVETLKTSKRNLISIEIKGGRDISNIHNRVGEAEKSHQKAKRKGFIEFMTIVSVNIDYEVLKNESPTTTHFFHLDQILDKKSKEANSFKEILSSILSIKA